VEIHKKVTTPHRTHPTSAANLERQRDLILHWVAHYEESFLDSEDTLFKDEAQIEASGGTHILIPFTQSMMQFAFTDTFNQFPYHLGVAWHLAKSPPEIFKIAKNW